jgi:hypothetical protein
MLIVSILQLKNTDWWIGLKNKDWINNKVTVAYKKHISFGHGGPPTPVIQLLGRWKQEDHKFEASSDKVSETLLQKQCKKKKSVGCCSRGRALA